MQRAFEKVTMMILRRTFAALALLSLTACSAKAPPMAGNDSVESSHAGGSISSRPPIHYDQTAVLTVNGRPQEEQSYRALLDGCQRAGVQIRALTPGDVAKIGRVHVEAWIDPDKQSRHEEEWHLDASMPCKFSLQHQDQTEIDDADGRATVIDGVTHKVEVQEPGKPAPVMALPENDGEMNEAARKAGWSKEGNATASEAQCAVWHSPTGFELCVWTGGRKWGYSANGPTALKDGVSRGDSIVLWVHPGQGSAWKLETKEFSVGNALDRRAFEIPTFTTRGTAP